MTMNDEYFGPEDRDQIQAGFARMAEMVRAKRGEGDPLKQLFSELLIACHDRSRAGLGMILAIVFELVAGGQEDAVLARLFLLRAELEGHRDPGRN